MAALGESAWISRPLRQRLAVMVVVACTPGAALGTTFAFALTLPARF